VEGAVSRRKIWYGEIKRRGRLFVTYDLRKEPQLFLGVIQFLRGVAKWLPLLKIIYNFFNTLWQKF
jgi:hypothetical protein